MFWFVFIDAFGYSFRNYHNELQAIAVCLIMVLLDLPAINQAFSYNFSTDLCSIYSID